METETLTRTRPAPQLAPADEWHQRQGEAFQLTTHSSASSSTAVRLTHAELQAIVQQAYDRHGIVAQLWTDSATNTDRPQSGCNGTSHCPSTSSHHFDCQAVQL